MKTPKLKFAIIMEEDGTYSAISEAPFIGIYTQADTMSELCDNILEAATSNLEARDLNVTLTWADISLAYDIPSLLAAYKIINVKEFGRRLGINNTLISQYASGTKKPSKAQANKILNGIKNLGQELSRLELI